MCPHYLVNVMFTSSLQRLWLYFHNSSDIQRPVTNSDVRAKKAFPSVR